MNRSATGQALESALEYLRDHPGSLAILLVLANLLSLLDLALTTVSLRLGAVEANPFMREFLERGVTAAAFGKFGIVVAASLGIWLLRRRRGALKVSLFFFALYAAVVVYQIVGIARLL